MQLDAVTQILQEAAEVAIVPRFRALAEGEVSHKSSGDVVTVADREAEELISRRLRDVLDAPVVGEEATAANAGLVRAVREAPAAWVVDPLDGTANFVAGRPFWAVMAALVRGGQTVAAWIVRPVDDLAYVAEQGSGAWRNGIRVVRPPAPDDPAAMRGVAHTRYLTPPDKDRVRAARPLFAELGPGISSPASTIRSSLRARSTSCCSGAPSPGTTRRARCSCARRAAPPCGRTARLTAPTTTAKAC